jgi:heat shock transcription factor, other eukaryote
MQQPNLQQPNYQYAPDNTDYSNYDFSQPFNSDNTFAELPQDGNQLPYLQNAAQAPAYGSNLTAAPAPSTDLVRRARNQPVVAQNGRAQEQWNNGGFGSMAAPSNDEDEQDLEMKVAMAKRDAQGKRKQIPPFVQKLSRCAHKL